MHYHSNATTNLKQRQAIRQSQNPIRALAIQYHVSGATISKWRNRACPEDRSCAPRTRLSALTTEEEGMILRLRAHRLSLDELMDTLEWILPAAKRATVHRVLVRSGVNRLPSGQQQATGQPGAFKEYGPGYLHIDCFYLPRLEGRKHYCFVVVDRATRLVYLAVYATKDKAAATDFLQRCLAFYPFRIEKILTDNGGEFTAQGYLRRWAPKSVHPFDALCQQQGIEHRRTRPYTPKTNGLAERTNGLIKQGTTKCHTYETSEMMDQDLQRWFVEYNYYRRHRRIGRVTPYAKVCAWYEQDPERFIKEPTHLLDYFTVHNEVRLDS